MGGKKTMEKRGHQVCSLVDYQVRQKITPSIVRKIGGRETTVSKKNIKKYNLV